MKNNIKEQISHDYLSGTLDQLHAEVIVPCLTESIDSLFEVVATYLNDAEVADALKQKYVEAIESCRRVT